MEELLAKYFSSNANLEEKEEVLKWREMNPKEYLDYKQAWISTLEIPHTQEGLERIIGKEAKVRSITTQRPWLKYAASVAIIAVAAIVYILGFRNSVDLPHTRLVKLDDGSKVMLYKDAEVKQLEFGTERLVAVSGRAYFDVERDEDRPFIILTDEAKVEVLGTSFTVNTTDDFTTRVIVESGVVAFSQNPANYSGKITTIKLTEGEMGVIKPEAKGIIKRRNRDENYLAWANQVLTFKRARLSEVQRLVKEVYGFDLVYHENLESCLLTATYHQKSPEQIASLIAETFGFNYQIKDKRIVLTGPGC